MEILLPTHLRLRKDLNDSYTNLLIIHRPGDLSALSLTELGFRPPQACAVSGLRKCHQFRLLQRFLTTFFKVFYDQIETFIPGNEFQM